MNTTRAWREWRSCDTGDRAVAQLKHARPGTSPAWLLALMPALSVDDWSVGIHMKFRNGHLFSCDGHVINTNVNNSNIMKGKPRAVGHRELDSDCRGSQILGTILKCVLRRGKVCF
jgi:hypothetical protein